MHRGKRFVIRRINLRSQLFPPTIPYRQKVLTTVSRNRKCLPYPPPAPHLRYSAIVNNVILIRVHKFRLSIVFDGENINPLSKSSPLMVFRAEKSEE